MEVSVQPRAGSAASPYSIPAGPCFLFIHRRVPHAGVAIIGQRIRRTSSQAPHTRSPQCPGVPRRRCGRPRIRVALPSRFVDGSKSKPAQLAARLEPRRNGVGSSGVGRRGMRSPYRLPHEPRRVDGHSCETECQHTERQVDHFALSTLPPSRKSLPCQISPLLSSSLHRPHTTLIRIPVAMLISLRVAP